jgi:enamine deaminase RidA (YjgF/YER057c/UK114 family)
MAKQLVKCQAVAQPIGPYSLGVRSGNLVFVSGTVGRRPDGSVSSDVREQCRQTDENVRQELVRPDLLVEVEAVAEIRAKRAGSARGARRPARKSRSARRR